MEIKRRVGLPPTTLHVMNRGARRVAIYADDHDRRMFVGRLGPLSEKYGVTLHAWCLMPNHYHLESSSRGINCGP